MKIPNPVGWLITSGKVKVDRFVTLLELSGLLAVAVGVGMIFLPAGIITLGLEAVFVGWLTERKR